MIDLNEDFLQDIPVDVLKEMLYKTHLAFGREMYFDRYKLAQSEDWDLLPDIDKDQYCRRVSEIAGIDHEKYKEIIKEYEGKNEKSNKT